MTDEEIKEELYERCINLDIEKSNLIDKLENIDKFLMYSSLSIEDYEKIKRIMEVSNE